MRVSYAGQAYAGFQTQPGLNTIQDQLESAIRQLTGEELKITASGRTDAGVHARGQVINFYTESSIPVNRWCMAINARLPDDILVWDADEVPLQFHARRSAIRKTYRYTIRCGRHADLFRRDQEFHHPTPLDTQSMQAGLQALIGRHDFTSYCSKRTMTISNVRTVYDASLEIGERDPILQSYLIHLHISGNGFLYNMVRIITGTLIQVGEGKRKPEDMALILAAKDRSLAGPTAVPHGLMLWEVNYAE